MSNRINSKKLVSLLICLLVSKFVYSTEYFTTRGKSTGDGFVAYSFGSESLVYNPAGAEFSNYPEIIVEYEDLLPQIRESLTLNRQLLGVIFPYSFGNTKISFGGLFFQFNSDIYKESIYQLSVAKDITNFLVKEEEKLKYIKVALGVRLKYMEYLYPSSELLENDPLFENNSRVKSVISPDIGVLYSNADKYYFGLTVFDLLEPDIGINQLSKLKRKIILSFGYKYLMEKQSLQLLPLIGVRNYFNKTELSLGVEALYKNSLFLRVNYSSWNTAVGIGYLYKNKLEINYTYVILSELNTTGGHYISLSYRFLSQKQTTVEETINSSTTEIKNASTTTITGTSSKSIGDKSSEKTITSTSTKSSKTEAKKKTNK